MQALGRALVFPKIWSAMDRWWAPHSGKIPGSSLDLPFEAPFDHIVDLEGCVCGSVFVLASSVKLAPALRVCIIFRTICALL